MTPRRRVIVALAAMSAIACAGIASAHYPPGPAKPCPGGTDAVLHKPAAWFVIKAPPQLDRIVTHAAGRPDGSWVLASDGAKVMRSEDGGCTWEPSFDVTTIDTGDTHVLPRVSTLVFPDGGATALMVLEGVAGKAGGRVLRSTDGGANWQAAGAGLPALGAVRDLAAAPSDANALYAALAHDDNLGESDPAGVSGALYASTDGGRSWEARSQGDQLDRVAVDPADPARLWAVRANHTVERSSDGGRTWAQVRMPVADPDPVALKWRDLAIARNPGKPATIVVVASPTATSDVSAIVASVDDGKSFHVLPSDGLGPVTGVTFGNSANQVLIVSGSSSTAFRGPGVHAYDIDYQVWRDVDDAQLNSLWEPRRVALSTGLRGHEGYGSIQLRRSGPGGPDALARYDPPDPPPKDLTLLSQPACVDQPYSPPPPPDQEPVEFTPGSLDVALKPGTPRRVPLDTDLAAVPAPLDLYFLVDTTTSMDQPIDAVLCSIRRVQRQLGERGVDVWMGVGAYQDRYDYRYRRYADLAPPGPALVDVLQNIHTRQGKEEPMRSGLYQTATGAGLDYMDTDSDFNTGGLRDVQVTVPRGQQASFRPDAFHTVVVVGNEPYNPTTPGEPSPDQVVAALKAKKALALGMQIVQTPAEQVTRHDGQRTTAHEQLMNQQLRFFASGTGAVAPAGGVDCDGDGQVDIATGQPLVCQIRDDSVRESLSDTLVALLKTFRDKRDVELVPRQTSGLQVSVENGRAASVDVGKPYELGSTLVLGCTAAQAGRTFPLALDVRVAGKVIGTLEGDATCGRLAKHVAPRPRHPSAGHPAAPAHTRPAPVAPVTAPPATPQPTPGVAVAPPPPPPAPAPVSPLPAPAPSPAPAGAPNPAPLASAAPAHGGAGVAMAPQQEIAPQVATARSAGEHAMVALRARRARAIAPEPALFTLGVGGVGAFAYAAWMADARRRRRLALARAERR
jgi:photosystem II stability/assembly factor-like uncharacterized protein